MHPEHVDPIHILPVRDLSWNGAFSQPNPRFRILILLCYLVLSLTCSVRIIYCVHLFSVVLQANSSTVASRYLCILL